MAPELRGSCLARRQGPSSDLRSVREKAQIAPVRKGSTSAFKKIHQTGPVDFSFYNCIAPDIAACSPLFPDHSFCEVNTNTLLAEYRPVG